MLAWRRLTLGSGSRMSDPSLRPMTMRPPSNVSEGDGPLADRTTSVMGIGLVNLAGDALQRGPVLVSRLLDPLDHVGRDVASLVLAELLDPRRRRHVHLGEPAVDDVEAHEVEPVGPQPRR